MKNFLKVQNLVAKKADGSIETAIKVLTAIVLGAAVLLGLYVIIKKLVIPSTDAKISSMFAVTDSITTATV